ncbi:MAG: GNAT family N-acetyltransferase [Nanoarchaeota archaeon]
MDIQKQSLKDAEGLIRAFEGQASPFQKHAWLSALHETLGLEPTIITFSKKKEYAGYIALFAKKAGITTYFSPPLGTETAYGGIVGKKPEQLYPLLKKEIKNFFVVHPAKLHIDGCICEPKYTIITKLDATHAEDHFSRLKKGHRYNIRKARKDNILTIRDSCDDKNLNDYYHLLTKTYAYKGFTPLPLAFYRRIITHYAQEKKVKLIIARKGKTPVGTIAAFIHNKTMYYWTGGFLRDPEYTKLYPNDVLQWKIIEWGYAEKIPVYDMLGGDIPGIREFKLGFGGELVEYTKIYSSRKLHVLAKAYGMLGQGLKNVLRKK